jgi:hypothetical protein
MLGLLDNVNVKYVSSQGRIRFLAPSASHGPRECLRLGSARGACVESASILNNVQITDIEYWN